MTIRRVALALAAAITLGSALLQGQVPGRNVNMVSGRTWPNGDPFLQRQNEPSIAASTRNPLHLLAGANDYRTVDLPGLPTDNETGDAWLGLFKSFDGGSTWRSTLVPGYPQDTSAVGMASPLKAYEAAADPVVRAGTNGLFYYTSIVFDRGSGGKSALAISRFIDNNNKEAGDPIAFVGTTLITTNTGSAFIDKPWFAVDIPRAGAAPCTIEVPNNSVQSFPGGTAYVVYSLISTTATNETRSQVYLSTSNNCGATWSAPRQISSNADPINQGATLAVDPRTGVVYIAWRRFSALGANDAIMVTRSIDRGRTWNLAQRVRQFLQNRPGASAFLTWLESFWRRSLHLADLSSLDQPTAPDRFRSNAYPTMTVDGGSRVHIAWAERGFSRQRSSPDDGDARVVISTSSTLGFFWTEPRAIDDPMTPTPGHQLMPSLSFAGGKLMIAYYDLREDVSGVFSKWIDETSAFLELPPARRRHTLDIRAAQANPATRPVFAPSVRVSEYLHGVRPGGTSLEQFQYNPPNFQLFGLGTVPFIGDYIDLAPSPSFVPAGLGKWAFNTATSSSPLFHVVWTDNRDIRPPLTPGDGLDGLDWKSYTPPDYLPGLDRPDLGHPVPVCVAGNEGMRNQNIYTARITGGLVAGSPGNVKPLDPTLPRAFVVFAQNATDVERRFRLAITNQPAGGSASFQQTSLATLLAAVVVPARSTVARNVYVTSTDPKAQVNVTVTEIGASGSPTTNGLRSTVVLNPDISNPDISNPDISNPDISNPDISNAEVYNPDISNPDISNPDISNPDISNPDISNPDISNVVVANPDISNPDISNPDISNPDISNPDISNPDISNAALDDGLTDTTWTVTNNGNTTTSYDVQLLLNGPGVPAGIKLQLVLHKLYTTPVAVDCELKTQTQNVLLANILNPTLLTLPNQVGDPDLSNGTLWLAPGETAKITLRVYDPNTLDRITFDAVAQITPAVVSQALNVSLVDGLLVIADGVAIATPPLANGQVAVVEFANPGVSLGPVVVTVLDNQGAVIPEASVHLSLVQLDGSTGVLAGGTDVLTDGAGQATFNGLTISETGRYRLRATVGSGLNFTILSGIIVVSTQTVVQWVDGNGHYYEYVRQPGLSWGAANAAAQARSYAGLSGHLVSIASQAENDFVLSLKGNGDLRAWIGLHDPDGSGTGPFAWVTGETFSVDFYENWAGEGLPDNPDSEFWVEMFADGTWNNNLENDPTLGYIVEYETPWTVGQQLDDPAGDTTHPFGAPVSPPDLISASTLRTGNALVFQVRFVPGTFVAANTLVDLVLDTDRNPLTGNQGTDSECVNDNGIIGAEYLVTAQNNGGSVLQYTGGDVCNIFSYAGPASVVAVTDGYDITVPLAAIGGGDGILNYKVVVAYQISINGFTGVLDYMSNVGLAPGTTGGG